MSRSLIARLLLAAIFFSGAALADVPTNLRIKATLTPSGKVDTRYRNGDDGSAEIPLTWTTISPIAVLTTDTGSINLCSTYLTQPGSPNADLTVATGYTLPTDFSLGGTNNCILSWSTPPAVNTTTRIDATRSGFTSRSDEFSITVTAPASSDTTAPTMPLKVLFTPSSTGGVLSWDASSDQRATLTGEAPSGMKEYDVLLNGSVITTVSAGSNPTYQFSCVNVGSSTPTPNGSQSGTSFTLTGGGAGTQGTNYQFYKCSTPVTGPFTASARIDSVTPVSPTPDLYSTFGFHFNEADVAGSKFLSCSRQFTDNSFQCKSRVTTDGSASNKATSPSNFLANNAYIRVKLSDVGVWTAESSTDGNNFTSLYSVDSTLFTMSSQINAGLHIFSRVNGSAATGSASNVSITTAPRLTYTYTGSGGNFQIIARDNSNNESAITSAVAGAPVTPPSTARKFNAGMFMTTDQRSPNTGYTCTQYETINGNARWLGAQERIWWEDMEPTRGNYDFSAIDTLAACLGAMNKRLVIQVMDRRFGTTGYTGALPAYLTNEGGTNCIWQGVATNGTSRVQNKNWLSPCMDRLNALFIEIYNHVKDMNNVHMVTTEEMATGLQNTDSSANGYEASYSRDALVAQWKRWADVVGPAYVKTGLCHYTNGPAGYVDNVMNNDFPYGIGQGGPDIIPNQDPVSSYATLRGANTADNPSRDYRLKVPVCFAVQRPELGGKEGNFTPAQFLDFNNNTLKGNYIWFVRQLVATNGTGTTWYDMDSYLAAGHSITNTSCPTQWTNGCDTLH